MLTIKKEAVTRLSNWLHWSHQEASIIFLHTVCFKLRNVVLSYHSEPAAQMPSTSTAEPSGFCSLLPVSVNTHLVRESVTRGP